VLGYSYFTTPAVFFAYSISLLVEVPMYPPGLQILAYSSVSNTIFFTFSCLSGIPKL
jgi:hypothetical protein